MAIAEMQSGLSKYASLSTYILSPYRALGVLQRFIECKWHTSFERVFNMHAVRGEHKLHDSGACTPPREQATHSLRIMDREATSDIHNESDKKSKNIVHWMGSSHVVDCHSKSVSSMTSFAKKRPVNFRKRMLKPTNRLGDQGAL